MIIQIKKGVSTCILYEYSLCRYHIKSTLACFGYYHTYIHSFVKIPCRCSTPENRRALLVETVHTSQNKYIALVHTESTQHKLILRFEFQTVLPVHYYKTVSKGIVIKIAIFLCKCLRSNYIFTNSFNKIYFTLQDTLYNLVCPLHYGGVVYITDTI